MNVPLVTRLKIFFTNLHSILVYNSSVFAKRFPWSEEHDLTDGETDPNGFWDAFSIALPIVDDFNNQIDSTNTLHTCASNNGSTLVWGVEAYEYQDGGGAGPAIDCIIVSESEATDAWVDDMKGEFSNLAGCDVIEGWTAE